MELNCHITTRACGGGVSRTVKIAVKSAVETGVESSIVGRESETVVVVGVESGEQDTRSETIARVTEISGAGLRRSRDTDTVSANRSRKSRLATPPRERHYSA